MLDGVWDQRQPVRLLGVTGAELLDVGAQQAMVRPKQQSLFVAEEPAVDLSANKAQRDKLLQAMDAIRDRHGEDAVRHAGKRRTTNQWGPEAES